MALIALVAAALLTMPSAAWAGDRDCSDFSSQAAAQNYFDSRGGGPNNNVDNLDADGDGRVCETNPCPCTGGGGDGGVQAQRIRAKIRKVVDGDTVDVRAFGAVRRLYTVRVIGIDTPEKYGGRECGASRASRSMRRLAPRGTRVTLVTDPSQDRFDRYGRLLAYVIRKGRDIGRAQISSGWARVYVVGSPFRRYGSYRRAQRVASRADRGVWRLCGGRFHSPLG